MRALISFVLLLFLAGSAHAAFTCIEAESEFTSAVEPLWAKARDAYAAKDDKLGDKFCDEAFDKISDLIANTPEQCETQRTLFFEFEEEIELGDVCGLW